MAALSFRTCRHLKLRTVIAFLPAGDMFASVKHKKSKILDENELQITTSDFYLFTF